ncbi:MAG: hypothetical protein M3Y17_00795 [Actinomycetota bacterium]|nr:hypothetical protein [Actinomycetota bacterium]
MNRLNGIMLNGFGRLLLGAALSLSAVAWPASACASALRWSAPVPATYRPPFARTGFPEAVSCPSVRLCVAVDSAGNVVTATEPTGGFGAWALAHVYAGYGYGDSGGVAPDISCPSVHLCVAVDAAGNVRTSTNPTAGRTAWTTRRVDRRGASLTGVSCPSSRLCVAVDDRGNVFTSSHPAAGPGAWTESSVDRFAGGLNAVSCPSAHLCFAVDGNGNAVTSTRPTGRRRAWTVRRVDRRGGRLNAVSCPSGHLCVAVDGKGNAVTSTDPFARGAAWTVRRVDRNGRGLHAVSCSSAHFCVAVDGDGYAVTSTRPTGRRRAWTVRRVDRRGGGLNAVSCPSGHLCVAVDGNGNAVTSTHPSARGAAWRLVSTGDAENGLYAVSCPFPGLCVAVGDVIATATDPTGPASGWTLSHAFPAGAVLGTSVSCPSVGLCVAGDSNGDILTSTAPTDPARTWTNGNVLPPVTVCAGSGPGASSDCYQSDQQIDGISCPSSSLCVGFSSPGDSSSQILTSSDPAAGAKAWRAFDAASLPLSIGDLSGVSCPSARLCVVVGDYGVATSTNPAGGSSTWKAYSVVLPDDYYATSPPRPDFLDAVSCPSASLCVAVDNRGNVLASTDPTGGPGAWTKVFSSSVDAPNRFNGASCASATLCVAVDDRGNVVSSTEPATAGTWTVAHADSRTDFIRGHQVSLTGVSCPSVSLCVAVDSAGNVVTGTTPATP